MQTANDTLLKVSELCAWYGAAQILYDVGLEVRRGEVLALMGRNGAGKSTTIKAIIGMLEKRSGQIRFMGQDIARAEPHQAARLGMGFVPEDRRIFTDLTVMENLEVGRQPPRRWPDGSQAPGWSPERLFSLFPNLGEMPQRLGGRMSGGEQQMLSIGRALMTHPDLIILDEATEGLAPLIVAEIWRVIDEIKASGMAVLIVDRDWHKVLSRSNRALVLQKGLVVLHGDSQDLLKDPELPNYLGV